MTEQEIKNLMHKYLNGTITKREERLLEKFDADLIFKNRPSAIKSEYHKKSVEKRLLMLNQGRNGVKISRKFLGTAVVMTLILSLGFFLSKDNDKNADDKPIIQMVHTTDWGQKMSITLADGTMVQLNSGSRLTFPDRFVGYNREVELTGEAFFDVAENKEHPFVIRSGELSTTVLGTTFNINAYPNNETMAVTLATGKVMLSSQDSTVYLKPNNQAVFDRSDNSLLISKVDIKPYIDWKNGIIHIKDASLAETAKILERWYGTKVIFDNENLKNCYLTATYDNQTLATVLESIKYVKKGLDYEFLEDNTILITGNCTD